MEGERNVRRVLPSSSLKRASRWHRVMTSSARSECLPVRYTGFYPCRCNSPRLERTDKLSRRPSDKHESDQNFPTIRIAVSCHREVVADHQNDDWNRHEGIVLEGSLALAARRGMNFAPACAAAVNLGLC